MKRFDREVFAGLVLATLAACAPLPPAVPAVPATRPQDPRAAGVALEQGLHSYEEGRFDSAALWLDEALRLGLDSPALRLGAHKHRAFIECMAGRVAPCKEHFRALLQIEPAFELPRAEAGHPMWGPVFRELRHEAGRGQPSR